MARSVIGRVVSDRGDKTIIVKVEQRRTHPLYKKQYRVSTKFMAHDEVNQAKHGDLVSISESRPISARKHYRLTRVIERAGVQFEDTDATADLPEVETVGSKPAVSVRPAAKEKKK